MPSRFAPGKTATITRLTRFFLLSLLRSLGAVPPPGGEPALLDLVAEASELSSSSESDSDKLIPPPPCAVSGARRSANERKNEAALF